MPKPRTKTSDLRVVQLGTGRPVRKREHHPRPPKLPVAHLRAHHGGATGCGRSLADNPPLADQVTRTPPEGHRLCGMCDRRVP